VVCRIEGSSEDGIDVIYKKGRIALDPRRPPSNGIAFVSHAHIDHVHRSSGNGLTIASEETAVLARERGFDLGVTREYSEGIQLVQSGHILGSRGLLIDGDVYYTSDFSNRTRAFLCGGRAVKCSTLIVESTFGKEMYRFPSLASVLDRANRLISDLFSKGIPVVLMGYPLGKAQILSDLFSSWDPLYVHETVMRMNATYTKLGIDLRSDLLSYSTALEKGLLERKPWILFSPVKNGRSTYVRTLKKRYGAVTMVFSGWSVDPSYKHRLAVDHAFPLSDHCDFDELVDLVKQCSPRKVYTVHGCAKAFASSLRKLGFDAEPLQAVQRSIRDYLEG
jgi:putative mRNA 3-end processing factor